MKIIIKSTKGCDQLSSKNSLFYDIWFSGVKTAYNGNIEGVDYCGPVKISHMGFFLSTLVKLMEEWLEGSHLVLKISPILTGNKPLMAIGYKYRSHKVLGFTSTDGGRSTEPGVPYLSRYPDNFPNVSISPVFCPHFIGGYFGAFNTIDNHNSMLQSDIELDKYWVT